MRNSCLQGVLALGDSITNGGGELQWGVALQSWAQWVSRGLGLPLTNHAVDGATVQTVLGREIPHHENAGARPDARYDVGCLYIGVNDVRRGDWDRDAYAAGFDQALGWLKARSDRALVCTLPLDLGRPRAGIKVVEANAVVRNRARAHGALVVELDGFGARNQVMTDHVHPTAFGQIAIAERALAALAGDGLPTRTPPASLVSYETTRVGRLRGDWTYLYRHAKVSARAWRAGVRGS